MEYGKVDIMLKNCKMRAQLNFHQLDDLELVDLEHKPKKRVYALF